MPNLHGSTIVANPLKIVRAVKCKLQSAFVGNAQFPLDVQSAHEVPGPPLEYAVYHCNLVLRFAPMGLKMMVAEGLYEPSFRQIFYAHSWQQQR